MTARVARPSGRPEEICSGLDSDRGRPISLKWHH
jgi:hypothetical protein